MLTCKWKNILHLWSKASGSSVGRPPSRGLQESESVTQMKFQLSLDVDFGPFVPLLQKQVTHSEMKQVKEAFVACAGVKSRSSCGVALCTMVIVEVWFAHRFST